MLTIHDSVQERDALATGCLNSLDELTAWQVCVACCAEKLLRYEVSENTFRFDESTVP